MAGVERWTQWHMAGWPSPTLHAGAAAVLALTAAVTGAVDHTVVADLSPARFEQSLATFTRGVPDAGVDARQPFVRVPSILPGPLDSWAGDRPHVLRLQIGPRPPRALVLRLAAVETHDVHPPILAVGVNEHVVTRVATLPGTGLSPPHLTAGVRSRYPVKIPGAALRDGRDLQIWIANESGSWIMWERIRLIEAKQRLAWIHLTYRLPPRGGAAALTAGSLVVLLIPGPGATRAGRRLRGFARPAAAALALILLGSAAAGQGPALASLPRWAWLAAPWLLILASLRWTSPAAVPDVRHARGAAPRRALPAWSTLRRLLPNVLLLVLSVTAAFAVCELVTRRMFPWPALHPLGFNHFGFREREFPLEKPARTYRVAVIGDSFTDAGAAIPEASRYTNRLEQLLNAGGGAPRFEVLSFGTGGHELVDHVETLRDFVLDIDPDFVLLQWYVNDFEDGDKTQRPGPRALLPIARLHQLLLENSAFYNLLQRQWAALQEALGLVESYAAYMRRRFGRADSVGAREFASNLAEFVALAARRSVPVGMVLFPHVGPALTHDYPFEPLHRLVLEDCAAVRIECLDLYPALAAHPDYRELMVTRLDAHPSELAHRLAAERILKAFAPAWGLRRE